MHYCKILYFGNEEGQGVIEKKESDLVNNEINAILKNVNSFNETRRFIIHTKQIDDSGIEEYEHKIAKRLGRAKSKYNKERSLIEN